MLEVREQEVVLEREERDAGGIVQLVRLGAPVAGSSVSMYASATSVCVRVSYF